jgi:hypothetical protein
MKRDPKPESARQVAREDAMEKTQSSLRKLGFIKDKTITQPGEYGYVHKKTEEQNIKIYCRTLPNYMIPILSINALIHPEKPLTEKHAEYLRYFNTRDHFGKISMFQPRPGEGVPHILPSTLNYVSYEHSVDLVRALTPDELRCVLAHVKMNVYDLVTALSMPDPFSWGGEYFSLFWGKTNMDDFFEETLSDLS